MIRALNLANDKKRDAEIGFSAPPRPVANRRVLPDGQEKQNVKYLKSATSIESLSAQYSDLKELGQAIADADPDVDIELVGKYITDTHRLYLSANGQIAYRVNIEQVIYAPDGTEKERRPLEKALPNVNADGLPVQWSGRKFPKPAAIHKFVFGRKYQLRHTNGLTYDFLYQMAKTLSEENSLMFIGAGPKGNEPLILATGGEPYRGFLEGRIDGDRYCLIMHLTNLELKALNAG